MLTCWTIILISIAMLTSWTIILINIAHKYSHADLLNYYPHTYSHAHVLNYYPHKYNHADVLNYYPHKYSHADMINGAAAKEYHNWNRRLLEAALLSLSLSPKPQNVQAILSHVQLFLLLSQFAFRVQKPPRSKPSPTSPQGTPWEPMSTHTLLTRVQSAPEDIAPWPGW